MEDLGALFEKLYHRGVETDRDRAWDLDDQPGASGWSPPPLTGPVAVPRAVHPEVGPDLETVVEADQQVLAKGLDRGDLATDDARDLGHRAGAGSAGGGDGAADEVRPKTRRRPEERVAFGHSGVAALRAEDQAAVAGNEAGLHQHGPGR